MPWISTLRFDPSQTIPKFNSTGTVADRAPHFYEEDMDKWKRKFEKHIKEREKYKKNVTLTHEFNYTTKNSNFNKAPISLPKRRQSRQSTNIFTSLDFEVIGDTNPVSFFIDLNHDHLANR